MNGAFTMSTEEFAGVYTGCCNVLVVDDDPRSQFYLSELLVGVAQKLSANSGTEAMELLKKNSVSAILLDINMPLQNGFEIARQIHQSEKHREIPIIFMTASCRSGEEMIKGYDLGAVDYLLKPIAPEVLRAKLKVFTELHAQRERVREQAKELERVRRMLEQERVLREHLSGELRNAADRIHELEQEPFQAAS